MCGIAGYVGRRKASEILLGSLRRLEYRGYDSCGIAVLNEKIEVRKDAGFVDEVCEKERFTELNGSIGIAHTRWATHGNVCKKNAHPHLDCSGEIAVVHNGIISNFRELKEKLVKLNHVFKSETDTEVIAHLIEEKLKKYKNFEDAFREALKEIKGTFAVAVLYSREKKIYCARMESPLLIGIGKGEMFVGSDISSFLDHTNLAVALEDGEYAVIDEKSYFVKKISSAEEVIRKPFKINFSIEKAEKGGYTHYMLKEIFEQPEVVKNALSVDVSELAKLVDRYDRVIFTGAGTSLHACMHAEYYFKRLADKFVVAVDSSELAEKCVIDEKTLVVGVTQSGETYDTLSAMKFAKKKGAKIASIVNVVGSTATRLADLSILQGSGLEIAVCATKTFTSQLAIILKTAIELGKMYGNTVELVENELFKISSYIKDVLKKDKEIKKVAEENFTKDNYFYIARGLLLPSALEGALKLKEITYMHAEGMSAGLLKHGTISLIDERFLTVALVGTEENRKKVISNIEEIKARGGSVVTITTKKVEECINIVVPETVEEVLPLIYAPVYQLLAYYTAVRLGRNVDKPRALAKSVTVE